MDMRRPSPVDRYPANLGLPSRYRIGVVLNLRPQIIRGDKRIGRGGEQPHQDSQHAERPSNNLKRPPHDSEETTPRASGSLVGLLARDCANPRSRLASPLEYFPQPHKVSGTPRTRVLKGLHLLCAGEVPGKPTSVQPLAPG